ncbi:MAG: preprotein translocase subunit YajC, partial [Clostridiales bacterium]|nr:preprotein translocase subunit YajC [Clostridiales bacterium]
MLDDAAAAAADGTAAAGSWWTMPLMLAVFVGAMYFFMIRPQKKQEKQIADMRNSLTIGDEITTNGGIIGRIVHIKDDIVTVETGADRVKIKVR